MITDIALHLLVDDIKAAEIIPRATEIGDRYWVIRLPTSASIYIDDADLRTLSAKISTALKEGTSQTESATSQRTPGPTDTVSGEGSTGST